MTIICHHFFQFSLKNENLLNKYDGVARKNSLWTPEVQRCAAKMAQIHL